ncbi:MAG TPA: hypothetical protein DCS43_16615 [Verrucomicrobia bacterium]|nr:hypothetical protein [Verrucomicrobiota bacterium]
MNDKDNERRLTTCDERDDMLTVNDLRCEYLANPLGVDTPEPRFSWKLVDSCRTHGQRQTAWQVVVDGVGRGGRETLWDSGKVATDTSVNVVYAGQPLRSSLDCRWLDYLDRAVLEVQAGAYIFVVTTTCNTAGHSL